MIKLLHRGAPRFLTPVLLLLLTLSGCAGATSTTGILVSHTVDLSTTPQPAPSPAAPSPASPEQSGSVSLLFVGDMMLARTPGQALARGEDPFAGFASVIQSADIAVGNLECVIATEGAKVPKLYNFRCSPDGVAPLSRYHWVVSVANNHSGDYGKAAFAQELSLLTRGGVAYFGGGMNRTEAHTPVILERNGLRIAFLGYDEIELRSYEAGKDTPGVAWSDDAAVVADIASAKARADLVVVYPHWGVEYRPTPTDRQRELARKMIDAGADLVVGSHPHVRETAEYYKGKLIVYSLGNFVFDDFLDVSPDLKETSRTSWVLRVTMAKSGVVRWDTLTARTDDQGLPRPVPAVASPCGTQSTPEIEECQTQ